MGLLVCCEIPLAIVFFVDRSRILDQLRLSVDVRSNVDHQATTIAVFLLVLAGLQALSLGLAFYQICRLTEAFDERQYEDAASSLLAGSRAPSRGGDKFGGAEEGVSPGQRYKSGKHAAYYEKYGLK